MDRKPGEIAAFKERLKKGLTREPFKSLNWIKWHTRQGMFADIEVQEPDKQVITRPPLVNNGFEQIRGQLNYLNNKVMELRVEKKQNSFERPDYK